MHRLTRTKIEKCIGNRFPLKLLDLHSPGIHVRSRGGVTVVDVEGLPGVAEVIHSENCQQSSYQNDEERG